MTKRYPIEELGLDPNAPRVSSRDAMKKAMMSFNNISDARAEELLQQAAEYRRRSMQ